MVDGSSFSTRERKIEYVILGLGLNVNWNPGEEEDMIYAATSILAESGTRGRFLSVILIQLVK